MNMLNFYTLCIYFSSFDAKFSLILLCEMLSCLIIPIFKSSHVNLQFINFPFDSTFYLFPFSTKFVDRIFRLISHLWDHSGSYVFLSCDIFALALNNTNPLEKALIFYIRENRWYILALV